MPRLLPAARALALGVIVLLTGCSSTTAASPAATEPPCRSVTHLSELTAEPLSAGPASACLSDEAIPTLPGSARPQLPVTLTDASGAEVTVSSLDRVITLDLSGTISATVIALGLADRLVARDSSSGYAEIADLPVVTSGGHTLSVEPLLALEPTLVITDGSIGPRSVLRQLAETGVPVVFTSPDRSLEASSELAVQVANALGVPERGAALAERIAQDTQAARAEIDTLRQSASPKALFLYLRGGGAIYYLFGAGSGADSLMQALGARDVASEVGWAGMRPVTAEALVAAAPDVVFVMTDGLRSVGGVDGLLASIPALAQTPAGQQRRIIDMADDEVLGFGPRSATVLRALAQALYAPSSLSEPGA